MDALATGDGRARGGLISKLHGLKDFGLKCEKLYNSCVVPVTEYGSSIWGYCTVRLCTEYRAIRYFLGVHQS